VYVSVPPPLVLFHPQVLVQGAIVTVLESAPALKAPVELNVTAPPVQEPYCLAPADYVTVQVHCVPVDFLLAPP
jgi:hypothetical protein